ncbi:hypothetical protein Goari_013953, partial [Gossypium aridum]|nr:hypothetical protein [Gossypium aridum]
YVLTFYPFALRYVISLFTYDAVSYLCRPSVFIGHLVHFAIYDACHFQIVYSTDTRPSFVILQADIGINAKGYQLNHRLLVKAFPDMVSLRRRKLLGLCSGRSSFLTPLPRAFDNGNIPENSSHNAKSVSAHPLPSDFINHVHGKSIAKVDFASPNVSGSGSSKEHHSQPFPGLGHYRFLQMAPLRWNGLAPLTNGTSVKGENGPSPTSQS